MRVPFDLDLLFVLTKLQSFVHSAKRFRDEIHNTSSLIYTHGHIPTIFSFMSKSYSRFASWFSAQKSNKGLLKSKSRGVVMIDFQDLYQF